ncbi:hypothetical protein RHMOL_Rhmol04G0341600 [Rhododendron molle]|uniref:Uncharacterized protein n=1 Tax=Rhododendron molle TaxID=49168 RepID=A0ACC0P7H4_RHOML|nr:hypothetical protein RHMOL_Rhmol04G0341600 [Rhododendron molle]
MMKIGRQKVLTCVTLDLFCRNEIVQLITALFIFKQSKAEAIYVIVFLMRSLWVVLVVMLAVENGCNGCLEKERIALLQLKDSINFPNGTSLPSWEEDDNMDCCHWERVECNSTTRRVIKLELDRARDRRTDGYWHLNASILLPFESLRSLNLYQNRLRSFVGNEGIGILPNWSNLEELDLSYNYFDNSVLPSLNKLLNLKSLRLGWNALNGSTYVEGKFKMYIYSL